MNRSCRSTFVPAIALDREAKRPLWLQLAEELRAELGRRRPPPGAVLPSSRELARMLGLARGTVLAAYEQLVAEGRLRSRRGAGYFVAEFAVPRTATGSVSRAGTRPVASSPAAVAPFRPGEPDMRLFPRLEWSRCMARAWRRRDAWETATDPFGAPELRRAVADHLLTWRSLRTTPDRILVTAGSIGGLELLFRAVLPAPGRVATEDPGYPVIRRLAAGFGHRVDGVPVDEGGIRLEALARLSPPPRLLVVTPSRQFPLGHPLAVARRRALLDWAEAVDALIVEDDYDSEYRYVGRPVPALAAMDHRQRVVYAGTFSKIFSAGIRLGYLAVPERLRGALLAALERFGTRASILPQLPLAMFLETGAFARHLRRTRRIYDRRRRFLLARLEERFGGFLHPGDASGGMSLVLFPADRRDPRFDDRALATAGRERGLGFAALSDYFAGAEPSPGLLLGFAAHEEAELDRGLDLLGTLLAARGFTPRRR